MFRWVFHFWISIQLTLWHVWHVWWNLHKVYMKFQWMVFEIAYFNLQHFSLIKFVNNSKYQSVDRRHSTESINSLAEKFEPASIYQMAKLLRNIHLEAKRCRIDTCHRLNNRPCTNPNAKYKHKIGDNKIDKNVEYLFE